MLSKRIIVIAQDKALSKRLAPPLMAAGANVETFARLEEIHQDEISADLVVIHVTSDDAKKLITAAHARMKERAALLAVIDQSSLELIVDIMKIGRVASVIVADQLTPAVLSGSATRLLFGDVFGLDKLLPWGVKVYSALAGDYQEKSVVIAGVSDFAAAMGVRRKYRESIEQVLDELLMNALYDAPVDKDGKPLFAEVAVKSRIQLKLEDKAVVQYACEGEIFAMSVRDNFGTLKPETVVAYLDKCLHSSQQIDRKAGGAGLGLYLIASQATQFVVNIHPGRATEVITTFDLSAPKVTLKQFGVFHERIDSRGRLQTDPAIRVDTRGAVPAAAAPAASPRGLMAGMVAAILLIVALIVIVAYPRFAGSKSGALAILTDPPGAVIELDGRTVGTSGDQPVAVDELPLGQKYKVTARLEGYEPAEMLVESRKDAEPLRLKLAPRASVVIIESEPSGAEVVLAGKSLGATPLTLRDLPPGSEQELTLKRPGYIDELRKVKVPGPGRETQIAVALRMSPDVASVRIESTPPGARILQNGELLAGLTTPVAEHVVQSGKAYTFTIKLDGHQPLTQSVTVPAGTRGKVVGGTLAAGSGLSATASLPDARITVDGVPSCVNKKTPLTDCPVSAGTYVVRVASANPPYTEERRVEVGKDDVTVNFGIGVVEASEGEMLKGAGGKAVRRLAMREGRQTVTVVAAGGVERQAQVAVPSGGTVRVPGPQ